MTEYVVQSGPLRNFEQLYVPASAKSRRIADYAVAEMAPRDRSRPGILAEIRRPVESELRFAASFLREIRQDRRRSFGRRDVRQGRAWMLGRRLKDLGRWRWSAMSYGASDDDLVLAELGETAAGLALVKEFFPPSAGETFFCVTTGAFDIFDIHWQRAARVSSRPGCDRFLRDAAAMAVEAAVTLLEDGSGAFIAILDPQAAKAWDAERLVAAAAKAAGLRTTFAPSLFG